MSGHTMACELWRAGYPLSAIQRQLGHSSAGTTDTYLRGMGADEGLDLIAAREGSHACSTFQLERKGGRAGLSLDRHNPRGEALMSKTKYALIIGAAAVALAGCGSNADTVSKNISKEAEKFKVQRHIIGINGITDKILFEVEGRCSIETESRLLVVTCKHGPKDYRKHYVGLSDNVSFVNVQTQGIAVSEYRTKIIIRPTSIVPDLDLVTGEQGG